ncbi:ATP-binding cassette domain-containing protein [Eubacterium pyruvativorans]|uniref:ATP-binding cassette domain-containing protein n=1 Tax=Eubacterium pyruvativorans TaxID=155865 RepID=UPI0023F4AFF2|nr:ATP-binding cassette domain-containing protein [Eubacterium pyruvativorans]
MTSTVLQMKNIVKSYRDGESERTILDHVDLKVNAGEFAAIVGPSGCGKSTLLNIAGMMLSPDSGEISLCGAGRRISGSSSRITSFCRISERENSCLY